MSISTHYNPRICTVALSAGNLVVSYFAMKHRLHLVATNYNLIQHINPTVPKDES